MKWEFIAVFVMAIGIAGCASAPQKINYEASPAVEQKITYNNGIPVVRSLKKSSVEISTVDKNFYVGRGAQLVVRVYNGTDANANIGTENVQVSVGGTPVRVRTYDELVAEQEEIKRSAANTAMMAAMLSGLGQMAAQKTGDFNSMAQFQTNQQTLMDATNSQSSLADQSIAELNKTILKRQTVPPGKIYGGYIQLDKLADAVGGQMDIAVDFAGERHNFKYSLTKETR